LSPTTGKSDAGLPMGTSSHELPLLVLECGTATQSYTVSQRGQADTQVHACVYHVEQQYLFAKTFASVCHGQKSLKVMQKYPISTVPYIKEHVE